MLTGTDDFAAPSMFGRLGLSSEAALQAAAIWKRKAWGLASALADEGHFSWEDLRQALLTDAPSAGGHDLDAVQGWPECQRWLSALARVASRAGLVDSGQLAELGRWAERAAARERR